MGVPESAGRSVSVGGQLRPVGTGDACYPGRPGQQHCSGRDGGDRTVALVGTGTGTGTGTDGRGETASALSSLVSGLIVLA
ncbi:MULTISPECIES: hypothetical protein [Streptomyces]|uniref:hypothetical protein n=1 Tax=Streptomyces TaxID=1883 RepID=UPI00069C8707|nr:hypothetical protein [Streptomyces sp. SID7805]MYU55584.1 hypothetical protein [Streptomyces sp. SID7805]